mgnify:CR=1 FL=1
MQVISRQKLCGSSKVLVGLIVCAILGGCTGSVGSQMSPIEMFNVRSTDTAQFSMLEAAQRFSVMHALEFSFARVRPEGEFFSIQMTGSDTKAVLLNPEIEDEYRVFVYAVNKDERSVRESHELAANLWEYFSAIHGVSVAK